MSYTRIRILTTGPGVQPQAVQEYLNHDDHPNLRTARQVLASDLPAELLGEAIEALQGASVELAEELGHLPPGLGTGEPDSIMVLIEPVIEETPLGGQVEQ